ncbi:hypothetical protein X798_00286 [Onchocerca flexuosa]|uniref:Proteolipid protein n=2 Tax=Onchocerca flexuosa TaxID=387005 RepID=A0A183I2K9_9BILA|nr:hypothetical protein X798_00286 [Onchocerca flexuosa]VDP15159.1 unnamed protein product [Onchocerca flexuosa]
MDDEQYIMQTIIDVSDDQQSQTNYQKKIVKPVFDSDYLKTISGMLKCICIYAETLDFICFICLMVGGPAIYRDAGRIIFICIFGMLISLILLIFYLFHIVDLLPQIPWIVGVINFSSHF